MLFVPLKGSDLQKGIAVNDAAHNIITGTNILLFCVVIYILLVCPCIINPLLSYSNNTITMHN